MALTPFKTKPVNHEHVAALEAFGGLFQSLDAKKNEVCANIDSKNNPIHTYLDEVYSRAEVSVNYFVGVEMDRLAHATKGKKFDKTAFDNLVLPEHKIKYKVLTDGLFGMQAVTECLDWLYAQKAPDSVLMVPLLLRECEALQHSYAYVIWRGKIKALSHFSDIEHGMSLVHDACNGFYTDRPGTKLSAAGYPTSFVKDLITKSTQIVSSMHAVMAYRDKYEQLNTRFKQMVMVATSKDAVNVIESLHQKVGISTADAIKATCVDSFEKDAVQMAMFIIENCYK